MATKTTAKSSKPAKSAAARSGTAKLAKPSRTAPQAAKPASRPATKAIARPATARVAKTGRALRRTRPERHEKPGTGRISRPVSADKVREINGVAKVERRVAAASPMPTRGSTASPFSRGELTEWRQTLLKHRAEILSDIQHLEKGAMEAEDGHTTPNHIAERGSDAEMQDMSLGLAGEEQVLLWQIDRALRKIEASAPLAYGLCEHTKQPIPKTRLQLIPWTPVSIEGMNYVEENGLALEDVLLDG